MARHVSWVSIGTLGWVAVCASIAAPPAFAMGKKLDSSPREVEYGKYPVIESHAQALSRSWKSAAEAEDADLKTFDTAIQGYLTSLTAARKTEAEAGQALAASADTLRREQEAVEALNKRIGDLDRAILNGSISTADRDRQLAEIEAFKQKGLTRVEDARKRGEELKAQLQSAKAAAGELERQIETHSEKRYGKPVALKSMSDGDVRGIVRDLQEGVVRERKFQHVEKLTDQLFDQVKDDYLKSGFLVSDLKHLQQQYGFTGEKLDTVKRNIEKRLNDTLLGNYIHDQIKKALARTCSDKEFQAACTAGNIQGIQSILDGALRSGRAEPAVTTTGAGGKGPAAAPVNGQADPAIGLKLPAGLGR